ncbi:RYamide [Anticarsia gemmatalis]|uniref:RYamide n=1 Tax=Anticarsia gemmatalis TaxID=129554 RepID=UPI003F768AF6
MCAWSACGAWGAWGARGGAGAVGGAGRCTCAALLLLLAVLVSADYDKRSDSALSPMPFVMGSRYGRSSPPKLIAPRNDRFFMGSRYGKRSEGAGTRAAAVWGAAAGGAAGAGGAGGAGAALLCEYTGVFPLYRCVRHDKRDHYDARSADEAGMGEEE